MIRAVCDSYSQKGRRMYWATTDQVRTRKVRRKGDVKKQGAETGGQYNKEKHEWWSTEEGIITQKNKEKWRNTEEVQHRCGD